MNKIKRVGLLTGGGDCPGLNAVIRGFVRTAILKYDWEVLGILDGFEGLMKNRLTPLTMESTTGILQRGGTILGTTNRGNPFEYMVEENSETVKKDLSRYAMDVYQLRELDALVVIGGDGSLKIAQRFADTYSIPVIGIPKTIDNDLQSTQSTFGFSTAVETATDAMDKLRTTAESHHRVMIMEVMGRYVGWIALYAGISGGANVILIPEIPFNYDKIAEKISSRARYGAHYTLIVVAEGAHALGEDLVTLKQSSSKPAPVERLGGIGNVVGARIGDLTGIETRVTVLGHIQRGGTPNAWDRLLSTRYGIHAAQILSEGRYGDMVCLKDDQIDSIPITQAVAQFKAVDPEGELVTAARSIGVSFGTGKHWE